MPDIFFLESIAKLLRRFGNLALIVCSAVGAAVRLEATTLVQMKQGPAKLVGRQWLVETTRAQRIRIERGQCFPLVLAGADMSRLLSKQTGIFQALEALKISVTAFSRRAWHTAHFCKRAAILRISPIVEQTHAAAQ